MGCPPVNRCYAGKPGRACNRHRPHIERNGRRHGRKPALAHNPLRMHKVNRYLRRKCHAHSPALRGIGSPPRTPPDCKDRPHKGGSTGIGRQSCIEADRSPQNRTKSRMGNRRCQRSTKHPARSLSLHPEGERLRMPPPGKPTGEQLDSIGRRGACASPGHGKRGVIVSCKHLPSLLHR